MTNSEVSIISHKYSADQIKNALQSAREWDSIGKIQERNPEFRSRGLDPTVLVAIVGTTGTALGTLIAGLFQLVSKKNDERIVLRSSNGATIEFPANLSPQELDKLIHRLRQLENGKYQILLP